MGGGGLLHNVKYMYMYVQLHATKNLKNVGIWCIVLYMYRIRHYEVERYIRYPTFRLALSYHSIFKYRSPSL